jgi:hypothetical protein
VVGDFRESDVGRDIIIDHTSHLQQINERHHKFMSMQYPLLFPYGEDDFHDNIMYREMQGSTSIHRQKATMAEYYAYRLHDRPDDFNTPLRSGRGTQAYQVDAYCCVERESINRYQIKSFQRKYCCGLFHRECLSEAAASEERARSHSSLIRSPICFLVSFPYSCNKPRPNI